MRNLLGLGLIASSANVASAQCPFKSIFGGDKPGHVAPTFPSGLNPSYLEEYERELAKLDWEAVKEDVIDMLTNSKEEWPADFGNYGGLMIRNAWHCAGSYRSYDGMGGCDGARIRFDPERSWDDNTNLDKARNLLWPIKEKYGLGLSWGDLIILAGTTAIESMGGPSLGFCGGRLDDPNGDWSELLGPNAEQELLRPCAKQGECESPLGASTVGLIYVNPEGPLANHDPVSAATQIREVFARMSMNDTETVSLIGGGHAFGKTHGACPDGPGPAPKDDPVNPWPGMCGTGKGNDTFTSGLEGAWTQKPTQWTNDYFTGLLDFEWELTTGPGGKGQWKTVDGPDDIMMLTTDIALTRDEEGIYNDIVKSYADDITILENDFAHSWYKLVTRDMGPVSRCAGPWVPVEQEFQNPLPKPLPDADLADFEDVKLAIKKALTDDVEDKIDFTSDKLEDGTPYYGAVFAYLAMQCSSTFRVTDYQGGCNGARIRFSPESSWQMNTGMDKALQILEPIKEKYGDSLSWADLIVLAGNVAIEEATAGTEKLSFCGGRTDAENGKGSESLQPTDNYSITMEEFKLNKKILGLTDRENVALMANLRSTEQMKRLGYQGSYTENAGVLSNDYFKVLINNNWEPAVAVDIEDETEVKMYKAIGKENVYMTQTDLYLKYDANYLNIAQEYAADNKLFLSEFTSAWTKVMNNDRFDGPTRNYCSSVQDKMLENDTPALSIASAGGLRKLFV